jgi:ABC-type polysaccharide/polyol phosphate transport system ATPase subunit
MSNQVVLQVKNFSLSYEPMFYRSRTVRDSFIELVSSPFKFWSKPQDRLSVLSNISFDVHQGDIIGLLGTNGVGKTSLCRYLSGIIKSDEIIFKGEARAVFDSNMGLYPDLTGRENATLLVELTYSYLTKEEREIILEESIAFSELHEFVDTPFKNYSKGMKSRLYLALVTARESDLVVLDEIFGGTDHFFTEKLAVRISGLVKKSGAAVLVSHSVEDIKRYCNRVIILSNKKVSYDGTVNEGIKQYLSGQQ